ncbi:MAG: EF-P beta-lysylation protein EpmB [Pseudomonadota bacterium]|nr:EF-P beta-lysylation protein EpmB [Pseudomonadota bacterium]
MINHLLTDQNWQAQINDLITDPRELLHLLQLPEHLLSGALATPTHFGLRVPRVFVQRMKIGDPHDPLLLQVLPLHAELESHAEFSLDPLGENAANATSGVLHKYKNRLLLTLTGACAIHCRYCFRRHFPYQANLPKTDDWYRIRDYIQNHPDVNEVILSGGDPLSVSNRRLFEWLERLESLPQLNTLRIHSRLPIVLPARMDEELLARLKQSRLMVVLVVHTNHPAELDKNTCRVLQRCRESGMFLLNQSVLLKGINDNTDCLAALSHRLIQTGVMPYYLHLMDRVQGAAHFDVDESTALSIYHQLMQELSGYLLPRLVREQAGWPFKVPVDLQLKEQLALLPQEMNRA